MGKDGYEESLSIDWSTILTEALMDKDSYDKEVDELSSILADSAEEFIELAIDVYNDYDESELETSGLTPTIKLIWEKAKFYLENLKKLEELEEKHYKEIIAKVYGDEEKNN